jgi:hypothetical protein
MMDLLAAPYQPRGKLKYRPGFSDDIDAPQIARD